MDDFSRGIRALWQSAAGRRRSVAPLPLRQRQLGHSRLVHRRLALEPLEPRQLLALTHLYTFNDGLPNDWVGNAHGTFVNGASVVAGQLVLANAGVTSGQAALVKYMKLPAAILPTAGAFTIEAWFTTSDPSNWTRVFDIGDQTGANGNSYVFYSPLTAFNDSRGVIHPAASTERIASGLPTNDGLQHLASVVVDPAADLLRLYIDGVEVGASPLAGANAATINDGLAYLGRSLFNADPGFTGSINELRIYDEARTASDIAGDAALGPVTETVAPIARQVEYLDRGVVAIRRATTQAHISWRLLGTDPTNIAFNLYRSAGGGAPVKLNAAPITTTTDFVDSTFNTAVSNAYSVRPVIGGVELAASAPFTLAANATVGYYLEVPLQIPPGGTTPTGEAYTYTANDASVGDVDGDGQYEIILKWEPTNAKDNSQSGYTGNVYVDAYRLDGTRLWRIDLGRNIRAGAHYTQFMVYDFDGDGRAEVAMKTAPGTIDGAGVPVLMGSDLVTADYRNSGGYILTGPEYLTVFDGFTGANLSTIAFASARGSVTQWGDNYGNRVDRYTAGVAYLDGAHPSIIMGRGYYGAQSSSGQARNEVAAYDFVNGQLSVRWVFRAGYNINSNINSNYIGQGAHSLTIGDVDGDGKDEIIYGAAAIDDTGLGLYSTGLGHGDALHISDMDPTRPGLEIYMPHEGTGSNGHIGSSLRDARTGALIAGPTVVQYLDTETNTLKWPDVGRGLAADIDPNSPGYEFWDSSHDSIYDAQGNVLYEKNNAWINFAVWWDADPLREMLDGGALAEWNYTTHGRTNIDLDPASSSIYPPAVDSNNGTKKTPALSGDLFGDWREEIMWRKADNTALRIFTTPVAATSRLVTLMHDTQYRVSIAAQNSAYNQPPHPSFFLGAGMAAQAPPLVYSVTPAPRIEGDFNGDNRVDALDLALWKANVGKTAVTGYLLGDADGNLRVDGDDFLLWQRNLGAVSTAPAPLNESAAASVAELDPPTTPQDAAFASLAAAVSLSSPRSEAAQPTAVRTAIPDALLQAFTACEDEAPALASATRRPHRPPSQVAAPSEPSVDLALSAWAEHRLVAHGVSRG